RPKGYVGWPRRCSVYAISLSGTPSPDLLAQIDLSPLGRGERTDAMTKHVEVMDMVARLKAAEEAFVLATVVRTVSVTAAKAGAKAIIRPDGTIVAGWIGGGGPRGGVLKPAREALADGEPHMVSVLPEN